MTRPLSCLFAGIVIVLVAVFSINLAHPKTLLTDFNGTWRGRGKDRASPLESLQGTQCETQVRADLRVMEATTNCNGDAGLRKKIQLTITLTGDRFLGSLTQTTTYRGDNKYNSVLNGSVSGAKTDKSAAFRVSFPGLTPDVSVTLTLTSLTAYTMHATTLGSVLMDVNFNRTKRD